MKTALSKPEIIMRNGKPAAVILSIKDDEELLECLEEASDVAWLNHVRRKPLQYRPLEDYLAERRGGVS